MRAGRLDEKITIQNSVNTRNEAGELVRAWGDFASPWASINSPKGSEPFLSQSVNVEIPKIFKIRYISGIDETFRIVHDDKYYNIKSIVPIGRNEALELHAVSIGEDAGITTDSQSIGFGNVVFG